MLALVLALGVFLTNAGWQIVKAAETQQQQDEELFNSDYNDVTNWNKYDATSGWDNAWCPKLSGQIYPQKDGDNGYLTHTQNQHSLGVIRLGHSYQDKDKNDLSKYVVAVPGKTYLIEYDMYVYANAFAQENNKLSDGWPKNNTMEIGIAVGNKNADFTSTEYSAYEKSNYTSDIKIFETFAAGTNPNSKTWEGNKNGWVHRSYTYTVPSDCDVSTNDALQLFVSHGSRCAVSFDNIKVTATAGIEVTYVIEGNNTKIW